MCEPTTLTAIGSWFTGTTAAAGTAAAGLTTAQTVALGLSAASGLIGAQAAYAQGQAAQKAAKNNAMVAEWQAKDAQRRGEEEAMLRRRQAAELKATQRTTMAARGLDLGYGTAADLQDQTDFFGEVDSQMIRTNAGKEAWGSSVRAANERVDAAARRPGLALAGSLLGSGQQVAEKWYQYTK